MAAGRCKPRALGQATELRLRPIARRQRVGGATLGRVALISIALGAACLLLPRSWTNRLAGLTQVLLPFQDATASAADAVADRVLTRGEGDGAGISQGAAERRAAALALRVQQLEEDVKLLTATRTWDPTGRRIGARGRLIPARVLTDDLLAWRASRLIDGGTSRGISVGDAVTTAEFSIEPVEGEGVRGGLAVLTGEVLVGVVAQAGSQAARVRLLSDPDSAMRVRVGRLTEQGFEGSSRYYWLVGLGPGRMELKDAETRDVESGAIRAGDLVLSDPEDELLPAAMMIGRVISVDENREKPLFAVVRVGAAVEEKSLRRVFVFDPGFESDPAAAPP